MLREPEECNFSCNFHLSTKYYTRHESYAFPVISRDRYRPNFSKTGGNGNLTGTGLYGYCGAALGLYKSGGAYVLLYGSSGKWNLPYGSGGTWSPWYGFMG